MNTNPIFYIPGRRSYTAALTRFLAELLPAVDHTRPLIILCIGTTQVQGDRLGPLVGTLLEEKLKKTDRLLPVHIFGTEEQAVHALNLPVILRAISRDFPGAPHSGRGCRHRCRTPPRLHYGWFGAASPRCRSVQTAARCGRSAYHRNGQPLRRSRLLFSETHAAQEGMPAGGYYF